MFSNCSTTVKVLIILCEMSVITLCRLSLKEENIIKIQNIRRNSNSNTVCLHCIMICYLHESPQMCPQYLNLIIRYQTYDHGITSYPRSRGIYLKKSASFLLFIIIIDSGETGRKYITQSMTSRSKNDMNRNIYGMKCLNISRIERKNCVN